MPPAEYTTIAKLLDAVDLQCGLLHERARRGEDINWLSVDRLLRANDETRDAFKTVIFSRKD